MKASCLALTSEQEAQLTALTTRGMVAVKTYRRATALLALHRGASYADVARQLQVRRYATVLAWANAFRDSGLQLLTDKPRSGRPLAITRPQRAALIALACSPAPDGRSQWSLRLLAGKSVELGHCAQMSASSAHGILKKTSCNLS